MFLLSRGVLSMSTHNLTDLIHSTGFYGHVITNTAYGIRPPEFVARKYDVCHFARIIIISMFLYGVYYHTPVPLTRVPNKDTMHFLSGPKVCYHRERERERGQSTFDTRCARRGLSPRDFLRKRQKVSRDITAQGCGFT